DPEAPATIPTEYVTRQSTRIIANGHHDYRADSINQIGDFPYPFPDRDNAMLEYLIRKAQELEDQEGHPRTFGWPSMPGTKALCNPWHQYLTQKPKHTSPVDRQGPGCNGRNAPP
ncbi:hypothetical protein ACFWPH_34705, partial [Nocardia sp. NPDC058499]|uniref:hypothetical protein n=1 Tax=Nocardia sp. NPDC058499 TaxID=3346530 RepID=UPI003662D655